MSPHIGWANAIPDANATADFTVSGKKLQFDGYGYHDKNWADQPFAANVHSWYWGHGRLGPYSIVWFDVVGADGNEYISSYAALNGQIIATSCSPGSIMVRPTGRNSQYPRMCLEFPFSSPLLSSLLLSSFQSFYPSRNQILRSVLVVEAGG